MVSIQTNSAIDQTLAEETDNTFALEQPSSRVIYEGSKAFWRHRCTLDLFVVLHSSVTGECVEVIGYHPVKDVESSRLYVDTSEVYATISAKELQAEVDRKKQAAARVGRSFHLPAIEREVKEQYVVNYILARVNIHQIIEAKGSTSPSSIIQVESSVIGGSSKGCRIEICLSPIYSDSPDAATGQLPALLLSPPSSKDLCQPSFQPFQIPHTRIVP